MTQYGNIKQLFFIIVYYKESWKSDIKRDNFFV